MWNTIKSDLVSFVTTVTEDLSRVIGEESEPEPLEAPEKETARIDLTRSFSTYSTPIEDGHRKEYSRFMKSFSLASQLPEIASILDKEPDVARFYADLVPVTVPTAEEFWSRYYFRLKLLQASNALELEGDEDDEEALGWEREEETGDAAGVNAAEENIRLKGIIKSLTMKITELERVLTSRDEELRMLRRQTEKIQQVAGAASWKRPPVASATTDLVLPAPSETEVPALSEPEMAAPSEPEIASPLSVSEDTGRASDAAPVDTSFLSVSLENVSERSLEPSRAVTAAVGALDAENGEDEEEDDEWS